LFVGLGGLGVDAFNQIVIAASEAVMLAVMRAMQQTGAAAAAVQPAFPGGSLPDEPSNPSPDGNGLESLEPFECTYTKVLQIA